MKALLVVMCVNGWALFETEWATVTREIAAGSRAACEAAKRLIELP